MLIQAAKRAVPLNLTILLVCILLVAYDAARSFTMSITHDEARTLAWHVTGQLGDILHFATPGLPDNNHLLFTLLAKGSVSLFGSGELALRLPSVLAYALYCVMMAHILARHLRGAMLLLYLLFAGLNPLLVDMMSIARGYGLGIALTTTGLYLLLRDCETSNRRPASWAAWASFSLALAVLAHLSFLLVYALGLGMIVLVRIEAWWEMRRSLRDVVLGLVMPTLITVAITRLLVWQIPILSQGGLLNTEGMTSFHVDTMQGLVMGSLYSEGYSPSLVLLLSALAYALPMIGLALGLSACLRPPVVADAQPAQRDLLVVAVLLIGTAVLSVLQHHLLGFAYLASRRAVFLYPLFVILCACLLALSRRLGTMLGWVLTPILVILPFALVVRYAAATNLQRTFNWQYDSQTKAMMVDLAQLFPRDGIPRYQFGASFQYEPSINYYLARNGWTSFFPVNVIFSAVNGKGPVGRYDVYYIDERIFSELQATMDGTLRPVKTYPEVHTILALPPARRNTLSDK